MTTRNDIEQVLWSACDRNTSELQSHINQINKDQTQRTNIKSSKGKTTNNTQGNSHKDNS